VYYYPAKVRPDEMPVIEVKILQVYRIFDDYFLDTNKNRCEYYRVGKYIVNGQMIKYPYYSYDKIYEEDHK